MPVLLTFLVGNNEIAYYAFSLMLAFFSCLEFLLSALYAFNERQRSLADFEKKSWTDRFKVVSQGVGALSRRLLLGCPV